MNTNLHIGFTGNCDAAFAFYETVFGTKRMMSMTWGEAPAGVPSPPEAKDLIMHTSLMVGSMQLMGADSPPGRGKPASGFNISLEDKDEAKIMRLFAALSEGGSVMMPLAPTFWAPLFGMCTDKFGVSWMLSVHESQA
jgi:PhnB protein